MVDPEAIFSQLFGGERFLVRSIIEVGDGSS